jgi:hypothetical protein
MNNPRDRLVKHNAESIFVTKQRTIQ